MFISCEGGEGCGKSTVLRGMAAWLQERGRQTLCTREPGGTALGRTLRGVLLDARNTGIAPGAELFLYLADRAQHVAEVVKPALEQGSIVLSDRYADSTVVYQGYGRGIPVPVLTGLAELAVDGVWPDCTLLVDLDPAVGLERARTRNRELGRELAEGRFEAEEMAFHHRVREGFRHWAAANAGRFRVIDGNGPPELVLQRALDALAPFVG